MSDDAADPTLDLAIKATCAVAPPERHDYIRRTLTRLWPAGFNEWYNYILAVGNYVHLASDGRLWFNVLISGFDGESTAGTVGLALYVGGVPLARHVLAFRGDFAGGLAGADKVCVTVAEVGADWTLPKAAGASLDPVESLTYGRLAEIARRAVALLDRAASGQRPDRRSWWKRLLGCQGGTDAIN
jgi:hypothetical protein